ncbi:hypothetical protein [Leifsonia xyli]|nr:hypothetical protein [Leifsonia xyli]
MIEEIRHLSNGTNPSIAHTRFCIVVPAKLTVGSVSDVPLL